MKHFFLSMLLLLATQLHAQTNKFTGTWRMEYKPYVTAKPIVLEWQVGKPVQDLLYPVKMTVTTTSFAGEYHLLCIQRSADELAIGRDKRRVREQPFSLRAWTLYLNGGFHYLSNGKNEFMTLQRIPIKNQALFMFGLDDDDEIYTAVKAELRDFLYRENITLKKINNTPWVSAATAAITSFDSAYYYGINKPIYVHDSLAHIKVWDDSNIDNDTISFANNGKILANRKYINDSALNVPVYLKEGTNLFAMFADNYGKLEPNTGSFRLLADGNEYGYGFTEFENAFATFLVAPVIRTTGKTIAPAPVEATRSFTDTSRVAQWQRRGTRNLPSFTVTQDKMVLEIWDNAIQDGDSISIKLNNHWLATGFPVTTRVQRMEIRLQPGENRLLFIADNMGSISPNTAAMRFIAGSKQVNHVVATSLKENAVLVINYQQE